MKTKFIIHTIGVFLILLLIIGCATPTAAPAITLTIIEDKCWVSDLGTAPYGEFRIQLVLKDKPTPESGYALVSLEAGKTFQDLLAWTSAVQPPWVVRLDGVHEITTETHMYSYDPANFYDNAAYHGGPVYLVCMRKNPGSGELENLGSFGPIEIEK